VGCRGLTWLRLSSSCLRARQSSSAAATADQLLSSRLASAVAAAAAAVNGTYCCSGRWAEQIWIQDGADL